jgi:hypothetical protein
VTLSTRGPKSVSVRRSAERRQREVILHDLRQAAELGLGLLQALVGEGVLEDDRRYLGDGHGDFLIDGRKSSRPAVVVQCEKAEDLAVLVEDGHAEGGADAEGFPQGGDDLGIRCGVVRQIGLLVHQ